MQIPIQVLDPDLPHPTAAHHDDAGHDLYAREGVTLKPGGGRAMVPTGIAIAIPEGYAGFVQPRSGLSAKFGVTVSNSPGLVDAGYRDELKVILVNTDPSEPYEVQRGDRIAQLVIQKVESVDWVEVEELSESRRGKGGFGSTGQ